MQWTVDLGPPFLRLTAEKLNDPAFRQLAVTKLRQWIAYDRLTLMRYHQFIPVLTGLHFPRKHRTCGDWARRRERRFFDTDR